MNKFIEDRQTLNDMLLYFVVGKRLPDLPISVLSDSEQTKRITKHVEKMCNMYYDQGYTDGQTDTLEDTNEWKEQVRETLNKWSHE